MEALSFSIRATALCAAGILVVVVLLLSLWQYPMLRRRKTRGPPIWPVAGMLPSVFFHLHDIYDWITQMMAECEGTIEFKPPWMANMFSCVTTDPRNIEYIVKTKFANFPKGSYYKSIFDDLLGDGILNIDGPNWERLRKSMSSILHSPAYKAHMIQTVHESVGASLMPVMESACRSGKVVDLQDLLVRFGFDNMAKLGLGVDLGCLTTPAGLEIAHAVEEAMDATISRFIIPCSVWKAMRLLGVGSEGRLKASLETIKMFISRIIFARRVEIKNGYDGALQRHDILSIMLRSAQEDDEGCLLTDKFLRDVTLNFILAGRDTTSIALCWFFWLLHRHPSVEDNILAEIQRVMMRRSNPEDYDSNFTVEEVKEMDYLHAALSETLRLYPSLPINYKAVVQDEVLPDGTCLKKGSNLILPLYSMARMDKVWGRDCGEFKPERWLRNGQYVPELGYKYPVFNSGPRVCLGKDFAYLQMKWIAASLVYRYRLVFLEDWVARPKLGITLCIKNGMRVTMHLRSE